MILAYGQNSDWVPLGAHAPVGPAGRASYSCVNVPTVQDARPAGQTAA